MRKILRIQLVFDGVVLRKCLAGDITEAQYIGRKANCIWRIPSTDLTASGCHATLSPEKDGVVIRDAQSRNGIVYNGSKIQEHPLTAGDQYRIGKALLVVDEVDEPERPERPERPEPFLRSFQCLKQLNGREQGRCCALKEREYVIGSSARYAQIVCQSPLVSRRHVKVALHDDGTWWVVNLGGRNGVLVNREPLSVEEAGGRMLCNGDVISMADVDFRFADVSSSRRKLRFGVVALALFIMAFGVIVVQQGRRYMGPDAESLLERARQCVEEGSFGDAEFYLQKITPATPHYPDFETEIERLRGNLKMWEKTFAQWSEVQRQLDASAWEKAEELLKYLPREEIYWRRYGERAGAEMQRAKCVAAVLEASGSVFHRLEEENASLEALRDSAKRLRGAIDGLGACGDGFGHAYAKQLIGYGERGLSDAERIVASHDGFVDEISTMDISSLPAAEAYALLEGMREKISKRMEEHGFFGRMYKDAAKCLDTYVEQYKELCKAEEVYGKAMAGVCEGMVVDDGHSLDFKFTADVRWPKSVSQFPDFPVEALSKSHDTGVEKLKEDVKKLSEYAQKLTNCAEALEKLGIETSEENSVWKIPEEMNELLDAGTWKGVVEFRCLEREHCGWALEKRDEGEKRYEPADGYYDRVLGIESFYAYIEAIREGETKAYAEACRVAEETYEFMPLLLSMRPRFSALRDFTTCAEEFLAWRRGGDQARQGGVVSLKTQAEEVLSRRNDLVESLRAQAKDRERELRVRLVLGGAALMLEGGEEAAQRKDSTIVSNLMNSYRKSRGEKMPPKGEETVKRQKERLGDILGSMLPGDKMVLDAINGLYGE